MKTTCDRKTAASPLKDAKAVEQTISLYHAWLAVLLQHLNQQELRVGVNEIKEAIGNLKCSVAREGGSYVIRMEQEHPPKEDDHADQS